MSQPYSEYDERDDGFGLVGDERAEALPPRQRRLPMLLLTLFVMALFAGGLYFAYVAGTRHAAVPGAPGARGAQGDGGVPLIRADGQPTKVRPDQPGGLQIPDQNVSLYNEKEGGPPVENLLPAPEQPMPRPAPVMPAPVVPAPVVKEPAAAAPNMPAPTAAPATAATAPAPPPAAAAAAKTEAKNKPAPAKRVAAAEARPERGGPLRLQLGSVRSPDAARAEWAKLKRDNADLLGKLTAVAIRTDLGDKGIYYRIEVGSFGDAAAAAKLCGELKRRNLGCILAR